MTLTAKPPQPRGHYDADKMARICTTWTRTDERCSECGSQIMRGQCDGRCDVFACSGCAAVFVDGEAMEPLFIPLKAEFFNAFERGEKTVEYRVYGPRWNEKTCAIGRPVVLSYGYGKKRRLIGAVASFHINYFPNALPGWTACYGQDGGNAACIGIKVEGAA